MDDGTPVRRNLARTLYAPRSGGAAAIPTGAPADPAPPPTGEPGRAGPRAVVRAFYADPLAWTGLAVAMLVLTYGGGAVMFWFHAVYLGEGGPAISPWLHWAMDSSAGCIGLTPAIALIIPLAAGTSLEDRPGGGSVRVRPGLFALVGGVLLAVVTAPAPLVHDTLLARGTWLGEKATTMWGGQHSVSHGVLYEKGSAWFEMGQQVVVGILTYVPLMFVTLMAVRVIGGRARRRPAPADR
jgi:hypothetical protein